MRKRPRMGTRTRRKREEEKGTRERMTNITTEPPECTVESDGVQIRCQSWEKCQEMEKPRIITVVIFLLQLNLFPVNLLWHCSNYKAKNKINSKLLFWYGTVPCVFDSSSILLTIPPGSAWTWAVKCNFNNLNFLLPWNMLEEILKNYYYFLMLPISDNFHSNSNLSVELFL